MLATKGSQDQLIAGGLKLVGHQLKYFSKIQLLPVNCFILNTINENQESSMLLLEDTKCKIGKTHSGISAKHNNDYLIYHRRFSCIYHS